MMIKFFLSLFVYNTFTYFSVFFWEVGAVGLSDQKLPKGTVPGRRVPSEISMQVTLITYGRSPAFLDRRKIQCKKTGFSSYFV